MSLLPIYIVFLFGSAVGSFINAFEYRLKNKMPVVRARSRCPHCGHVLAWYDLIPLLSFLLLRGRCRYCRRKISFQYPVVELVTGLLFLIIFLAIFRQELFSQFDICHLTFVISRLPVTRYPLLVSSLPLSPALLSSLIAQLLFTFFIAACLEIIFIYDLKYGLIPDEVIVVAGLVTSLYLLVRGVGGFGAVGAVLWWLTGYVLSALGAGLFFIFLVAVTRGKGMGGGDVKLAFLMGLVLGFPRIVLALYVAFISGALVALFLLASGKKKFGQTVPFGPFLAASAVFVILFS